MDSSGISAIVLLSSPGYEDRIPVLSVWSLVIPPDASTNCRTTAFGFEGVDLVVAA